MVHSIAIFLNHTTKDGIGISAVSRPQRDQPQRWYLILQLNEGSQMSFEDNLQKRVLLEFDKIE